MTSLRLVPLYAGRVRMRDSVGELDKVEICSPTLAGRWLSLVLPWAPQHGINFWIWTTPYEAWQFQMFKKVRLLLQPASTPTGSQEQTRSIEWSGSQTSPTAIIRVTRKNPASSGPKTEIRPLKRACSDDEVSVAGQTDHNGKLPRRVARASEKVNVSDIGASVKPNLELTTYIDQAN